MGVQTKPKAMKNSSKNAEHSKLPLVLIVNSFPECNLEKEILRGVARVQTVSGFSTSHLALIQQATIVVVLSLNDLSSPVQQQLSYAELVVCIGSGNPQIEAGIAEELQIQRLVHVNVQLVDEAADTTMSLILSLLRRTHMLAASVQRGVWSPNPHLLSGAKRCAGLTLGLLGLDNVALAVAQRALGFGFNFVYFDPLQERDLEEAQEWAAAAQLAGLEPAESVEALLQAADVVSLHCTPGEDTLHLLDAQRIAHFKPGAVLVSTVAGEVMDEDAIRVALLKGKLGGCALDAVDGTAWFEAWVRDLPNLILTPRTACYSDQAFHEQRTRGASVILRFLKEGAIKTSPGQDNGREGQVLDSSSDSATCLTDPASPSLPGDTKTKTASAASPKTNHQEGAASSSLAPEPDSDQSNDSLVNLGKFNELMNSIKNAEGVSSCQTADRDLSPMRMHEGRNEDEGLQGGAKLEKTASNERALAQNAPASNQDGRKTNIFSDVANDGPGSPAAAAAASSGVTLDAGAGKPTPLGMFLGVAARHNSCDDTVSDTSSNSNVLSLDDMVEMSRGNRPMVNVVEDPLDLVEGMVVALRVPTGAAATQQQQQQQPPKSSTPTSVEAAKAKDSPGSETKDAATSVLAGWYYGIKLDPVKKAWSLEPMQGLTKADPAVQLMVIRRKEKIGFRAGLAEGKVLQLTKKSEFLFANHNFGSWESWQVTKEADHFALANKKWKSNPWKVSIEVVGEIVNGVVRLKV